MLIQLNFRNKNSDALKHAVRAKLALTEDQKERGFQYMERPTDKFGILFYYGKKGKKSFWMKNCKFPLDVVSVDNNGKILRCVTLLHGHNPPQSCTTPSNTHHVIELVGGTCAKYNIRNKDIVKFIK